MFKIFEPTVTEWPKLHESHTQQEIVTGEYV